jgi:hypothetical protein
VSAIKPSNYRVECQEHFLASPIQVITDVFGGEKSTVKRHGVIKVFHHILFTDTTDGLNADKF